MNANDNDIDALLAQLRRLKAYDSRYDYERHFDTLVALVAERDALRKRVAKAELAAEQATTASLLHSLALIREAGKWDKQMLSELPDAVKAMREQRDEARREVCNLTTFHHHLREGKEVAAKRGWDCFKEGGGA